ncbi:MraW methylase family-domain-containing protein [Ochromonadaceae sp. CCMP2298]|nr:MraW methylase family-domain-containing protein [Ochromonadaceae sp. CCMP2298]
MRRRQLLPFLSLVMLLSRAGLGLKVTTSHLFHAAKRTLACSTREESDDYWYHVPVMRDECCDLLKIKEGGVYVDCTLGGGGHTKAILERGGSVIGLDQDPDAIARASGVLSSYIASGQCELIQTNFRHIRSAVASSKLAADRHGLVDGVLMDLGISSFQINEASRGFAFGQDGPLDMRMNKGQAGQAPPTKGFSAHDIINEWEGTAIADVLFNYGDETRSRVLAREIVAARPLHTTFQLEAVISRITPYKQRSKTLARCFQALRIVVNDEIGALEDALESMHEIVTYGGMFVVMSYHSLEDRRVKQLFRSGSIDGRELASSAKVDIAAKFPHLGLAEQLDEEELSQLLDADAEGGTARARRRRPQTDPDPKMEVLGGPLLPWESVSRRAFVPSEVEVEANRRARSAKLRAAVQVLPSRDGRGPSSVGVGAEEGALVSANPVLQAKLTKARGKGLGSGPKVGAKQRAKMERERREAEEQ